MLDRRAFAFYNTAIRDWHVESGSYQIQVGASSRDIRLTAALQITSSQKNTRIDPRDQIPAYLHFPADARIAQQDFETLLGKPVPVNKILEGELYTMNTCIADMQGSFVGRQLKKIMQNQLKERIKQDPDSPNSQMMQAAIQTAPPRLIMMFTNILNRDMMDGLMEMINGRFFKGLLTLLRAARQRR
jgi:beta-glucosidase